MLKQTHFLALDEAKVGNAKKPSETLLDWNQCCCRQRCENPVPCTKALRVEGGSKLCR